MKKVLIEDAIETCSAISLLIKKNAGKASKKELSEYQHAPVSLFPTPYPLHLYSKIYDLQRPMGSLVSSLTAHPEKIESILKDFLKYDQFLARLVEMSKAYNKYALSEDPEIRKKIQSI